VDLNNQGPKLLESRRKTLTDFAYAQTERLEADGSIVSLQIASLWRHRRLIAVCVIGCMILGALVTLVRPVTYTATARLLIDNRNIQLPQRDAVYAQSAVDLPFVQNQLELLKSEKVSLQVVDQLDLDDDEDFAGSSRSLIAFWQSAISRDAQETNDATAAEANARKRRFALQYLQKHLFIGRIGESYTLEVRFTSKTPQQAADVANGIVNTYIASQVAANNEAAQSATAWLRDRIRGLGPNARLITEAASPVLPDGPGRLSIIVASVVAGTILGCVLAFARDLLDSRVRTPAQAAVLARAECFGILPTTSAKKLRRSRKASADSERGAKKIRVRDVGSPVVIEHPLSPFAYTLRRLRTALIYEQADLVRTIGVTSAASGEGKSTVAVNLALSLAEAGKHVLLVDAAVYDSDLTRRLTGGAQAGLFEVLGGTAQPADVIWQDPETGLHLLPTGKQSPANSDLIWSERLGEVLRTTLSRYDYVIFDLPSLAPFPDVRAASQALDALLLVIRWGATPSATVDGALSASGNARAKLLGVVLNNGSVNELRRFGIGLPDAGSV
jgi:polysaccharide biosynthesis transport protein